MRLDDHRRRHRPEDEFISLKTQKPTLRLLCLFVAKDLRPARSINPGIQRIE